MEPGVGDIIFIPYMERMNASLIYYKGFNLRSNYRHVDNWLTLLKGQVLIEALKEIFILILMIYLTNGRML